MICANESFKGSCYGDSGGPLYDSINNVVVGVMSFGFGECDLPLPSVFARISDQVRYLVDVLCVRRMQVDCK